MIARPLVCAMLLIVFTKVSEVTGQLDKKEDYVDGKFKCWSCRNEAAVCEVTNYMIRCPPNPEDYTLNQLQQFRCKVSYSLIDGSVYQGCASKCDKADVEGDHETRCSNHSLGNCINSQCYRVQYNDGIIAAAAIPDFSPMVLFFATLVVLNFIKH